MDFKSNFYTCSTILNNSFTKKNIINCTFDVDPKYDKKKYKDEPYILTSNKYIDDIAQCIGKNYQYIIGWETAKSILHKICLNNKYTTKILFVLKSVEFISGFYRYIEEFFPNFDFENHFELILNDEKKFKTLKSTIKINGLQIHDNYYKYINYNRRINNCWDMKKFDLIIASNYLRILCTANNGYYIVLAPKEHVEDNILYLLSICKLFYIIDVAIMNENIFICKKPDERLYSWNYHSVLITIPSSIVRNDQHIELYKTLQIQDILNSINLKFQNNNKIDYYSIWFSTNEKIIKSELNDDIQITDLRLIDPSIIYEIKDE